MKINYLRSEGEVEREVRPFALYHCEVSEVCTKDSTVRACVRVSSYRNNERVRGWGQCQEANPLCKSQIPVAIATVKSKRNGYISETPNVREVLMSHTDLVRRP
jgi:hypothetical protein